MNKDEHVADIQKDDKSDDDANQVEKGAGSAFPNIPRLQMATTKGAQEDVHEQY